MEIGMLAATDQSGNTPAHWATKGNKINILRFIAQVLSPFLYAFDVRVTEMALVTLLQMVVLNSIALISCFI